MIREGRKINGACSRIRDKARMAYVEHALAYRYHNRVLINARVYIVTISLASAGGPVKVMVTEGPQRYHKLPYGNDVNGGGPGARLNSAEKVIHHHPPARGLLGLGARCAVTPRRHKAGGDVGRAQRCPLGDPKAAKRSPAARGGAWEGRVGESVATEPRRGLFDNMNGSSLTPMHGGGKLGDGEESRRCRAYGCVKRVSGLTDHKT